VTGVGGTSIGIGKHGNREWEYGWQNAYYSLSADGKSWTDEAYSSGGGGGTSVLFDQPFYQRGKVPASISTYFGGAPARTVPDISMPGDPNTGFRVGQTQAFSVATLGTTRDEMRLDTLGLETTRRYWHHYNFPPFSVGEAGFMRGPKRRDIGHGALAERALAATIPDEE